MVPSPEKQQESGTGGVCKSPAHLDVVIRTGHLGVVFHVEAVLEAQGDEETLLQLDAVQAV